MDNWNYWKKPLKLHELLAEMENLDENLELPDGIAVFPPSNANGYNTDEDSGDENILDINNLPGSQLMAEAEVIFDRDIMGDASDQYDNVVDLAAIENNSLSSQQIIIVDSTNAPLANNIVEQEDSDFDSKDNLPLSTFQKRRKLLKNEAKPSFCWKQKDIIPKISNWQEVSGAKNFLTPLELFSLFIDDEVIENITHYSNLYASQHNRAADICPNEIKCFIGILLLSGYHSFPRRAMYWENSEDAGNKLVYSALSRDRFNFLMQNIHCNNNINLNNNDKFSKMRPLFDILNKKFDSFSPVEECHSLDESMVPYYGGHGSKQFIRGKPIRWGYKLWTGTTKQGYIEWFEPYQGLKNHGPEQYQTLGVGANIVLRFADVLQLRTKDAPFHIFFDNFFTSMPLLKELTTRGLKCTGTLRENRVSSCPLKSSKLMKKEPRGTFEYTLEENSNIMICKWNDNNVVTIASNATSPFPTVQVKRFSQKEKKNVHIAQPYLIKKYNENMGGVDRADQNISLYRVGVRGKKWYFSLFAHCLDMAEQNAWQLHKYNGGKMDHLSFRRCIASGLLETYKRTSKRGPSKKCKYTHMESKYDRLDHLIIYQEKQTRCAICHKQAAFRCHKCDIALHPKLCFLMYHTKE